MACGSPESGQKLETQKSAMFSPSSNGAFVDADYEGADGGFVPTGIVSSAAAFVDVGLPAHMPSPRASRVGASNGDAGDTEGSRVVMAVVAKASR
jgi:hypothetical protein